MTILKLWIFFKGYVTIKCTGKFTERFLNICYKRGFNLWDIKKIHPQIITFNIFVGEFIGLRNISKKTKVKIKIINKKGIYFKLNRLKKRKAFLIGPFLFVALIYFMTSFIWSIEVYGNELLDKNFIKQKLSEQGIKQGSVKYNINTKDLADTLILNIKELSWVCVSKKGTTLKVLVAEKKNIPEILPKNIPCSIIATRDGIIKNITVKAGETIAVPGDTVRKGDLLVSGEIVNKKDVSQKRLVHVLANIEARTWYEKKVKITSNKTEEVLTDNIKKNFHIILFGKKIDLSNNSIDFNKYEKMDFKKNISLGEDLALPFEFNIEQYTEKVTKNYKLNEEESRKEALNNALLEVSNIIPKSAIKTSRYWNFINVPNDGVYANVIVECLEDIGKKVQIGGN